MTKPSTPLVIAVACLALCLWVLVAHGPGREDGVAVPEVAAAADLGNVEPTKPRAANDSNAVPRRQDRELLVGHFEVIAEGEGFRIRSNHAPRAAVLQRLAEVAPVTMTIHTQISGDITTDLHAIPLERAVEELLQELPFAVQYRFDSNRERHVPASLWVGEMEDPGALAATEACGQDPDGQDAPHALAAEGAPTDEPDMPRGLAEEQWQEERYRNLLATRLGDHEPAPDFSPNAFNSKRLLELLENDPNDQIRTAAAYQLAGASGTDAKQGLLRALTDHSAPVVVRALQSLAEQGDASLLPEVRAAASQSSDRSVQAALAAAEEKLQAAPLVVQDGPNNVVHHASKQ